MYKKTIFHIAILTVLMLGMLNTSCKKDPKTPANPIVTPVVPIATPADLSKDSLYYLFKDEYLFTEVIPAYDIVNPRASVNNDSLFAKLTRYVTVPTKDHYSFIDKQGFVANEIGLGQSQGDFGIEIFYPNSKDYSELRVKYVTKGSPAYALGIHKGWQITAVNGNTNNAYDGSDVGGSGANINRVVNAFFYSNTGTFVFKKPDATSVTKMITAAKYTINPIMLDTVYTFGAKKVGYMVFSSFIDIKKIRTQLDALFSKFVTQGVTELIVDLRYNGGGAVNTSEYLADLIAPKSVGTDSTKTMYTYDFNSRIKSNTYSTITSTYKLPPPDQSYFYSDLLYSFNKDKTTNFVKKGNLDIRNVVFLVTKSTASASELLINNLKPYMNVTLVGRPTYGKPVGFFGIPVGGYNMFAISFKTINANNEGDYYTGMPVSLPSVFEDYSKDFGQLDEVYLNNALQKLGVTNLPVLKVSKASMGTLDNSKFDRGFKGMIETRKKK